MTDCGDRSSWRLPPELHDEIERLLIAADWRRINELFRSGRLKDTKRGCGSSEN